MEENKIVPVYKIVDGQEEVTPIKRSISKTMEITETFNMFDVLTYVAKLKRAITDKEEEIKSIQTMIDAYEEEISVVENQTGISDVETAFQAEIAKENEAKQANIESALKDELLKTGNFEEKPVVVDEVAHESLENAGVVPADEPVIPAE